MWWLGKKTTTDSTTRTSLFTSPKYLETYRLDNQLHISTRFSNVFWFKTIAVKLRKRWIVWLRKETAGRGENPHLSFFLFLSLPIIDKFYLSATFISMETNYTDLVPNVYLKISNECQEKRAAEINKIFKIQKKKQFRSWWIFDIQYSSLVDPGTRRRRGFPGLTVRRWLAINKLFYVLPGDAPALILDKEKIKYEWGEKQ